jgi:ATP-dependent exoDNAse (exonuclease V) alpha subunit
VCASGSYTTGSRIQGIGAGEYARVAHVNAEDNLVTVRRTSGSRITYDPRRLHGVTLYRETDRAFAIGDRVQFTAPDHARHIANRELGTIEAIEPSDLRVRLDSGRTLEVALDTPVHLDYGYALTSHTSQGQTADRVLVHIDIEHAGEQLVNRRLAYVALSRGRYDAQIYTNDKVNLAEALGREVSHHQALEPGHMGESVAQASTSTQREERDHSLGWGR